MPWSSIAEDQIGPRSKIKKIRIELAKISGISELRVSGMGRIWLKYWKQRTCS